MEQQNGGADEDNVLAMIGDWREEDALKQESINIDELLQTTSEQGRIVNAAIQSQAQLTSPTGQLHIMTSNSSQSTTPPPAYPHSVPTFSSSANRPSVLDLSTTAIKGDSHYSTGVNMNGHSPHQQRAPSPHSPHHHQNPVSPHSPHHSPYVTSQPAFNYNNTVQHEQHSPVSPHGQQLPSPISPHHRSVSPHSHHSGEQSGGPMSPHMAVSPHNQMLPAPPPLSPHSPYSRSVSPHSQHNLVSPVSPHHNMSNHSAAGMSPHHPGMHGGAPLSPHHMSHSGSLSPVPRQHSPAPGASSVFSRYTASPVSMHSGNSSDTDSFYGRYSPAQLNEMRKRGINVDKESILYKAKRERNNVAVRKSREKKKQREQETERRVKDLSDENSALQNKLDIALKEMNLLKNLYKNIGVQLPAEARNKLENELAKFK